MRNAYVVTGLLTNAQTVTLDEALPLSPMRVRVVIEPLASEPRRSYQEVMSGIRARQQARGHCPPTQEEVDAYVHAERESWDP